MSEAQAKMIAKAFSEALVESAQYKIHVDCNDQQDHAVRMVLRAMFDPTFPEHTEGFELALAPMTIEGHETAALCMIREHEGAVQIVPIWGLLSKENHIVDREGNAAQPFGMAITSPLSDDVN